MMLRRIRSRMATLCLVVTALAAGCSSTPIELRHVHGLGYSADGSKLIVPAHDGLVEYAAGKWQVPDLPKHDYMGFVATDDGFYSSGHPGTSDLPNPLGLIKSTDGGKTIQTLAFQGESDFHLMGVGYKNHTIYVGNSQKNSRIGVGLFYSLDDGRTWKQSGLRGLSSQPIQIAVHPTKPNVVAIATESGLFLSSDYGDRFDRVGDGAPVTAVSFHPSGNSIVFGFKRVAKYDLETKKVESVSTPTLGESDAIGYIAINPARLEEMAIATAQRDLYLTPDGGKTWKQIAKDGRGQQP
jgi:WD40 repeat protein